MIRTVKTRRSTPSIWLVGALSLGIVCAGVASVRAASDFEDIGLTYQALNRVLELERTGTIMPIETIM